MKDRSLFISILLFFHLALSVSVGLLLEGEIPLRLGTAAALLLPVLLLSHSPSPSARLHFAPKAHAYLFLLLLPLFVLTTAGVSIGTGELFRRLGLPVSGATPLDSLPMAILFDALLPAVCEELFCRGALFAVLRPMGRRTAILFSAALFAFMHGSPAQLPYAFLAGVLLALLYELTGSLLFPILFHFANNLVSLLLIFGAPPVLVFTLLGGIAALGLLLFCLCARRAGLVLPEEEEEAPVRELLLSPSVAYLAIMALLLVL